MNRNPLGDKGETQAGDLRQDGNLHSVSTTQQVSTCELLWPQVLSGGVSRFVPHSPGSQMGLENSWPLHQSVTEFPHPKVAAPCNLLSGCHLLHQIPNSPSTCSAVPATLLKQESLSSVVGRPRSHRLMGNLESPSRFYTLGVVGVGGGAGSFPQNATWQAWGWGWGSTLPQSLLCDLRPLQITPLPAGQPQEAPGGGEGLASPQGQRAAT